MKTYSQTLLLELNRQLEFVHAQNEEPIKYSEQAIKILIPILEQLKTFFVQYEFPSKDEEIHFFKHIKPQFVYKLIYYNEVYNIETNTPYGGEKVCRKFYNTELEKLKMYFDENLDFYRYYRTGNNCLDKKYFLRGKHDIRLTLDSFYFQADHRFTTSHDFKVAQIMANDLIQVFLEGELYKLDKRAIPISQIDNNLSKQKWTGSKVALVELIYALHAEGVFNNGASDLKDVAEFFEQTLNVDLGQFHRTFLEIRMRKSDRTKFLSSLRETILKRMDEADET
jgi:hypothetical protein